jgi:esterase/lipase
LWYDYLKSNYNEKSITVYGRGIGATFATFIASINNPRQLILESPLYDLYHTAKYLYPYLPFKKIISKYKFDTASHIKKVKCNIHIFHGKKDELVNYKNSVMLYQLSKENTDLSLISDGNHYNLINHKIFLDRIKEILRE